MKAVRRKPLFAYIISITLIASIALIFLLFFGHAGDDASDPQTSPEMHSDPEEAQGTTTLAQDGDLIPATATNGQEGYVLKSDLDKATGLQDSDIELAARIDKAVPFFRESLSRHLYGGFEIDDASAREMIEVLRGGLASPECLAEAAAIVHKAAPTASRMTQEELESIIQEALLETDEELTALIPVYLEDGRTRVGYLPVSAF